jgi:hypothetical protein
MGPALMYQLAEAVRDRLSEIGSAPDQPWRTKPAQARIGLRARVAALGPFPMWMVVVAEGNNRVAYMAMGQRVTGTVTIVGLALASDEEAELLGCNMIADVKAAFGERWQIGLLQAVGGALVYVSGDVRYDEAANVVEAVAVYASEYDWSASVS